MQYDPGQSNPQPSPIEPAGFFTGIQLRPVIAGVVIDIIATIVLVTAYYSLFVAKELAAQGGVAEDAFAEYWNSSEGLVTSLLIGSLGTMIGGFYAAYKARTLEMKHGALVGIGSIILALIFQAMGSERELPEWFMALSLVAAIPAGALGGFFAEMFKNATGGSRSRRSGGLSGRG
ncbi:MAG: TIGR04086 family membrane protein [Candidatus Binatia bacterium]